MPKFKINVNAYGLQAGQTVEGEPDQKLVAAGIFSLVEEVQDDELGGSDGGSDDGDGNGADEGSDSGTE